jgi:N-acetylmuramoyl-L-alanine amidase
VIQQLSASLLAALVLTAAGQARASTPATPGELYAAAVTREQALHAVTGPTGPALKDYRAVVAAYDTVVRRFPTSGYVDNALWQGAAVANEAFQRFRDERDRATARRMLELLVSDYPVSPYVPKARDLLKHMGERPPSAAAPVAPSRSTKDVVLRAMTRTAMPDRVRVTLDLDGATTYRSERVEDPPRVMIDLTDTRPGTAVSLAPLTYQDQAASQVRVSVQAGHLTRVVVSLDGVSRYNIVSVDQPYRVVLDCERVIAAPSVPSRSAATSRPPARMSPPAESVRPPLPARNAPPASGELPTVDAVDAAQLHPPESEPVKAATVRSPASSPVTPRAPQPAPASPPGTATGGRGPYSMTRQLGLGASKIVIDPGHGGRDPGALGAGVSEAEVVLDVSLRLEKLLRAAGVDVVLTRRTDEYVPLEERPAIATREQADLFLSIHANASHSRAARGVESYFLNFSTDPAAEEVASRENAATSRTINNLPDILKAITLNNKLDESRTFAALIQTAMATQLSRANSGIRDLGVKQAPFVVLIGADMPSVLVEIAFITNPQEGRLLKSGAFRQRIAQALFDAVRGYQKSLKTVPVASRD